jgi:TolB-like protein
MCHLFVLTVLVLAGAPGSSPGDLVVWPTRNGNVAQGAGMEASLAQLVRARSVLAVSAQELAVAAPETLRSLRACQTDDCLLEIAGAFGVERVWIGRVESGAKTLVSVTRVQRGGAPVVGRAPWDGAGGSFGAAIERGLAGVLGPGTAAASAPAPTSRGAAPAAVESERLEPPATDLRGRVRFLAERLHAGFAERAGDAPLLRVAVLDFDNLGPEAQAQRLGSVVSEVLLSELSHKPKVLVVERRRLKELVGELKLQSTADLDPRTATEIGKFLGAASMIVGSVSEAGAQYVLSARQVSVENAAVIQAESVAVDRGELVALSRDLVEVKSRLGAALRSTVVPGWGEIYNGDGAVGALFLGAGLASAGAAATFGVLYKTASDRYHQNTAATASERDSANRYAGLTNAMIATYAAVWAANIAYAYFTGREATDVREVTPAGGALASF